MSIDLTIVESTDDVKENGKDNVIQFQEVNCKISGKDHPERNYTKRQTRGNHGSPRKKRRRKDDASLPNIWIAEPYVRRDHCSWGKDASAHSRVSKENGLCSSGKRTLRRIKPFLRT